ncbi:MAG: hypothetical protein K6C08_04655 [Oscillospiraceae bacterium]|nr:hypothetical protein [Oscillospiraceae bacterium]
MESFYDSIEHKSDISTYTVDYVLNHYKDLDGQEMYIVGYVSSVDGPNEVNKRKLLFLVPDPSSVAGYMLLYDESTHSYGNGYDYEASRQEQYLSIRCDAPLENNNIFNDLVPGMFIKIHGKLENTPRSIMDIFDGISYPQLSTEEYKVM